MNLSFSVVYTLLCHSGDKIARCRGAVFGLPDKNFFGLDRKEPRDSGLFMDLDFSCFRVSVCVNRPPRPRGERAEKGADLLIPQQEDDILGGHIGVGKVGLRQQLPRVVELFLEARVLLLQPALQPSFFATLRALTADAPPERSTSTAASTIASREILLTAGIKPSLIYNT